MKIWRLYVDIRTLSNRSPILDILVDGDENNVNKNILFGVTTSKKDLNTFFNIHRREMFLVVSQRIDKEEYDELLNTDGMFHQYIMKRDKMTIIMNVQGVMRPVVHKVVLTTHEIMNLAYAHEALDDCIYNLYINKEELMYYYKNLFTKRVRKALDTLGLIPTLDIICDWYGDTDSKKTIHACEWLMLREQYYEVMIGGDRRETPFI